MSLNKLAWLCLASLLLASLLGPACHQLAAAKKLKEKKLLKQLVKGLLLRNLSVKKNFLPLPVPFPGKWQSLATDLGELIGHRHAADGFDGLHRLTAAARRSATPAAAAASLATKPQDRWRSAASALVDLALKQRGGGGAQTGPLDRRLISANKPVGSLNKLDVDSLKKLARLSAAKYASKLIDNASKATSGAAKPAPPLISGSLAALARRQLADTDPVVVLFNVVKLTQQLRQLDGSKLLKLSKKSSLNVVNEIVADYVQPYLSMNINNKKSLVNKMNYIHSLRHTDQSAGRGRSSARRS